MTDKKLRKLCNIWVKRLRLQDWHFTVKQVATIEGMQAGEAYGGTTCKPTFMEAAVQIRTGLSDSETELTLVHELLHVAFGGMSPPEGVYDFLFETGIERTARILVGVFNGKGA